MERGLQRKQKLTQTLSSKKTLYHKVTLVSQCGKERKKGKFSKKNSLKNIFLKEIVFLSLKYYNNQILFIKTINFF
jgi:hypothetical protein